MPNSLTTVATFADSVEANLAKNRLEASSVRAFLANDEIVDMVWYWGNAIGWIKLQVDAEDAGAARAILSRRGELEPPRGAESEEPAAAPGETEPGDELDDEDDGAGEPDRARTARDKNAERAARGAVLGLLFYPLEFYVFCLLLMVFVSGEPLGTRERRKAVIAAVINFFTLLGMYLYIRAMWIPPI
jgi:hypothetical protein